MCPRVRLVSRRGAESGQSASLRTWLDLLWVAPGRMTLRTYLDNAATASLTKPEVSRSTSRWGPHTLYCTIPFERCRLRWTLDQLRASNDIEGDLTIDRLPVEIGQARRLHLTDAPEVNSR
jgi:hypothetical protein